MALRKQYSYLLVANGLVALAAITINALIPRMYSINDLSNYIFIKRIITTMLSIQLVGANLSIPFFYPKVKQLKVFTDAIKLVFFTTLFANLLVGFVILKLGLFEPDSIGFVSFLLFSLTLAYNTLTFSIIRAQQNFKKAALQHCKNMFIYPVVGLIITQSLPHYFLFIFSLSFFDNTYTLTRILTTHLPRNDSDAIHKEYSIGRLIRYGLQRYPMFVSQIFIAALPIVYLKVIEDIERIAVWGAALTILRLVIMLAGPVNVMVLPRFSEMLKQGRLDVRDEVWMINMVALIAGPLLMGILYFLMGPAIHLWIGVDVTAYALDLKILSFCMPFMLSTELVRGTVDALQARSINSAIYIISIFASASMVLIYSWSTGFETYLLLVYLLIVYVLIYFASIYSLHKKIIFKKDQIIYLVSASIVILTIISIAAQ